MVHWIATFRDYFAQYKLGYPGEMLYKIDQYRIHYAITVSYDEMMKMLDETSELLANDRHTMEYLYGKL